MNTTEQSWEKEFDEKFTDASEDVDGIPSSVQGDPIELKDFISSLLSHQKEETGKVVDDISAMHEIFYGEPQS